MAGSFRINDAALKQLLSGPDGLVWRDIRRRSNNVQKAAQRLCPVDTGRLRASIGVEMRISRTGPVGRIGTSVKTAIFVHEGTGIYAGKGRIYPKNGKVLAWRSNKYRGSGTFAGSMFTRTDSSGKAFRPGKGGMMFARSIKGMKGRPFLRDALPAANL